MSENELVPLVAMRHTVTDPNVHRKLYHWAWKYPFTTNECVVPVDATLTAMSQRKRLLAADKAIRTVLEAAKAQGADLVFFKGSAAWDHRA